MERKRFYVYPAGISGVLLGEMILKAEDDCEIIYIDDRGVGITLEDYKDDILQGGFVVNLANNKVNDGNKKTIDILKKKLEKYGISYNEEAFCGYTLKMVSKITNDMKQFTGDIVGIELCGIASDKHIGYLDDYLLEHSRVNLLYICATKNSLENVLKKFKKSPFRNRVYAICFPLEHTEKLSFLKALCKTSILNSKNNDVPTIYLGHALSDWSKVDMEKFYGDKIDYLSVGLKEFAPSNLKHIKIVESGYLGFDLVFKKINFDCQKDSILFAPYNEEEFFKFLPFMKRSLKKYRVIYRHRGFFEGKHLWCKTSEILKELRKNPNFSIDDSWSINPWSYSRSFAFVGGITTAVNTFPVLALCPSVSDNRQLNLNLGVRVNFDKDDFFEIIEKIFCNQQQWRKRLLEYRELHFYHFGYASKIMGDFIISKFL